MFSTIRPALAALAFFTVATGVVYPLLVTGISVAAFPSAATGSLVMRGDTAVGSSLIGQAFTKAGYLWGRPSATIIPYDARSSSGSNLGPTNPALDSLVRARIAALHAVDPTQTAAVPVELVTASASGLDPHLSPAAAEYQVARIAKSRRVPAPTVRAIIAQQTEARTFGILGEPRVNVLRVNLALDSLTASTGAPRR